MAVAAAVLGVAPMHAAAQDWREVTSFRQRGDESRLDVHVRYGAGELRIHPGTGGELYRLGMRYDSHTFDPITEYRNGRLEVGVETRGRGLKLRNTESGDLDLSLSRDVPMELDLDFGAVEARIELGGMRLSRVDIETGASDTELVFSEPNPVRCDRLEIAMGAAAFSAEGLGHANCERVKVEGGVGDLTLEFAGAWRSDIHADITVALGSVTILVPENVGVRVDKDTFLADFSGSGFRKSGGAHYSRNWDDAARRLTVDLEGAFGSFSVRWIAAETLTP
jgi:hypothetical protein